MSYIRTILFACAFGVVTFRAGIFDVSALKMVVPQTFPMQFTITSSFTLNDSRFDSTQMFTAFYLCRSMPTCDHPSLQDKWKLKILQLLDGVRNYCPESEEIRSNLLNSGPENDTNMEGLIDEMMSAMWNSMDRLNLGHNFIIAKVLIFFVALNEVVCFILRNLFKIVIILFTLGLLLVQLNEEIVLRGLRMVLAVIVIMCMFSIVPSSFISITKVFV